jgi:hypothetical protein
MNILPLLVGLFAGLLVAGVSHRVTAGFGLPKFVPAAAVTGWFAFVSLLFGLLLFCLDPPPAFEVPWGAVSLTAFAVTALIGWLVATYVRRYTVTALEAFGIATAKFALVLCLTGTIADFVRHLGESGASDFWFAYGLSCALTFLVLETNPTRV